MPNRLLNNIHQLISSSANIQNEIQHQQNHLVNSHHQLTSTINLNDEEQHQLHKQPQQHQFHHHQPPPPPPPPPHPLNEQQHPLNEEQQQSPQLGFPSYHQLKQISQSFENQSFPHNLSFNFSDSPSLLQTDPALNSLQNHCCHKPLNSPNLQEQSNTSSKQSSHPQDPPITSKDHNQLDHRPFHLQQQSQSLKVPTRIKSASSSPTASNLQSIAPQESSSTSSKPILNHTGAAPKSYQHGTGTSEFVKKLYKMLEEPESESVVGWGRAKTTLVIKDQILFQKDILPKHFKHSNFASFVRQLNKYDFRKFKPSPPSNGYDQQSLNPGERSSSCSNSKPGTLQWEFYHPHFRADTLSELDHIKRKVPVTRQKPTEVLLQTTECQSGTNSWEPTEEIVNRLMNLQQETSSALNHLTQEHKNLKEELKHAHNRLDFQQRQIDLLNESRTSYHQSSQSRLGSVAWSSENALSFSDLSTIHEQNRNEPVNHRTNNATNSSTIAMTDEYTNGNLNSMMIPSGRQTNNKLTRWSRPPRVLVVEDDQICRTISSTILNLMGCKIEFACDGLDAVSRMRYQIGADMPFDLVLMDIFMPNMDGLIATSLIRKFDLKTPIISMTSNFQPIDLVKYIDIGMNDCLPKPFTKEGMTVMLQKHLFNPSKQINSVAENMNKNSVCSNTHENQDITQSPTTPTTIPRKTSSTLKNIPTSSYSLDMNPSLKRPCDQQPIDFNQNDNADQLGDPNLMNFNVIHSCPENSLSHLDLQQDLGDSSDGSRKRSKV